MSMANTGKEAEKEFEDRLRLKGKSAYFYRITDASDVRGMTGKIGHIHAVPSDYIVVDEVYGTHFAECKSTSDPKGFPYSLIKTAQWAHFERINAAGGMYVVYIKNMNSRSWFRVPLAVIAHLRREKIALTWGILEEQFRWTT